MSSPKSKIPVPISRQKAIVTAAKLNKNKNIHHRLYSATTCSRRAQEEENFKNRTTPKINEKALSFQKPIKIQLKEDLEKLRRKAAKDESIIRKQHDEIAKLKELVSTRRRKAEFIQLQAELQKELLAKHKLQSKLSMLSSEKQKLNSQLIELLEVKSVPENHNSQQLDSLKAQIKKNKDDFQVKLQEYQQLLQQKDIVIQEQQIKKEQLLQQHQHHIHQINQEYSARVKSLESKHQETTTKPRMNQNTILHLVEQVLKEFEQEQHQHPPPPTKHDHVNIPTLKTGRQYPVNQQWYSQKYMPFDAISWPTIL